MHNRFLFFLIPLALYALANFYICKRGMQALPNVKYIQISFLILIILLSVSLFVSYAFERFFPFKLNAFLELTGSAWLVIILYVIFFILFFDLLRLINHFLPFFPSWINEHWQLTKLWAFLITVVSVTTLCTIGYIRFSNPKVVELSLAIEKKSKLKNLRMVAISDVHLGYTIQKKRLGSYVDKINSLHPDLVLIAGDLFDRSIKPVMEQKMDEELQRISSKWGVYAIYGNHEYIGHIAETNDPAVLHFLNSTGIRFLRDSVIEIDHSIYIIGRDDKTNSSRKTLDLLAAKTDLEKPVILLDHQPYHLDKTAANKIDLQISGHTHNGQIFPLTRIIKTLYEIPYGYGKKEHTHFYISSGLGLWGPPFRIGTQSEILVINLTFL